MTGGAEASAASGVAIDHDGRRVLLKWHMLRRRAGEPPFSLANLREGMAAGASVEIDVRLMGDGDWICLHDDALDEETDGRGPVHALNAEAARGLRVAGADYAPPLLADVMAVVRAHAQGSACLQIDLKEPAAGLDAASVGRFAALIAPAKEFCVLSGTDWQAVERLGASVPGLTLGFDPYDMAEGRSFCTAEDIVSFMDETMAVDPRVRTFYLYHRFVDEALALGANPVALLKRKGAFVDVWTLDPSTPEIEALLPRMIEAGADQITTNDAVAMAALWERLH